jgi:Bacterial SH3 domain
VTSRILGLNLSLDHTLDAATRDSFTRAMNAAYAVVMVNSPNDVPKIVQYQAEHPYTTVIGRVYYEQDGGMHMPPQAPADEGKLYTVSPVDWMNVVQALGHGKGWVYLANEPDGDTSDEDTLTRLVDWTEEWMRLAIERKVKTVLFNFGDRHPKIINGQWEARYHEILRLIAAYPELFMIGLHSYGPDPLTEHLEALVQTCKALTIDPIKVVLSEFGVDTHEGSADGYQARGWTGKYYAEWTDGAVNGELKPYITAGVVVGICTFCWNANPRWKDFDVQTDTIWQETILDYASKGRFDIVTPPAPPLPAYTPDTVIMGAQYRINTPGATRRLRKTPALSADQVGTVDDAQIVTVLERRAVGIDYWYDIRFQRGIYNLSGWVSQDGGAVRFIAVTSEIPILPPPPPPPTLPPPFLEVSREFIVEMQRHHLAVAELWGRLLVTATG